MNSAFSIYSESHHAAVHGDPVAGNPPGTANQGRLPELGADHRRRWHCDPDGAVLRYDRPDHRPAVHHGLLAAEHLLQEGPKGDERPPSAVVAHPGPAGAVHVPAGVDLLRSVQRDEASGYCKCILEFNVST